MHIEGEIFLEELKLGISFYDTPPRWVCACWKVANCFNKFQSHFLLYIFARLWLIFDVCVFCPVIFLSESMCVLFFFSRERGQAIVFSM